MSHFVEFNSNGEITSLSPISSATSIPFPAELAERVINGEMMLYSYEVVKSVNGLVATDNIFDVDTGSTDLVEISDSVAVNSVLVSVYPNRDLITVSIPDSYVGMVRKTNSVKSFKILLVSEGQEIVYDTVEVDALSLFRSGYVRLPVTIPNNEVSVMVEDVFPRFSIVIDNAKSTDTALKRFLTNTTTSDPLVAKQASVVVYQTEKNLIFELMDDGAIHHGFTDVVVLLTHSDDYSIPIKKVEFNVRDFSVNKHYTTERIDTDDFGILTQPFTDTIVKYEGKIPLNTI